MQAFAVLPKLCPTHDCRPLPNVTKRHDQNLQPLVSTVNGGVRKEWVGTQNPPTFGSWGFDSPSRHQPQHSRRYSHFAFACRVANSSKLFCYLLICYSAFRGFSTGDHIDAIRLLLQELGLLCFSASPCHFPFPAAADKNFDKKKGIAAAVKEAKPSYELPQPAKENLDYNMYQLIRDEGLAHSHVMEYASALADGIGPRLTGSPNLQRANEWTRDQLTAMGCSNAHPRRLGRVRHGLATAQHMGAHVVAGPSGFYRSGGALVAID